MGDVLGEQQKRNDKRNGFTLLELLVVLLILGLLASIAAPQVFKYLSHAKSRAAKLQIDALSSNLDLYKLDVGAYPTTEQGLKALVEKPEKEESWTGPYITSKASLADPWGQPYVYAYPGKKAAFDLYSLGADKTKGGEGEDADISNAP